MAGRAYWAAAAGVGLQQGGQGGRGRGAEGDLQAGELPAGQSADILSFLGRQQRGIVAIEIFCYFVVLTKQ